MLIIYILQFPADAARDESATKEIIFGIVTRMDLLRFITNEAQVSDDVLVKAPDS